MSESLVIHLRDGAAPQWLVCNADGQVVVKAVSGDLEQATAMAAGRRVAVIVPSGEVLVTDSDAPAKGAAKLAQVDPLRARRARRRRNRESALRHRRAKRGDRAACPSSS